MYGGAELPLEYEIVNAPMRMWPYPHIYVENVFPVLFYEKIQEHMPSPVKMQPISEVRPVRGYPDRYCLSFEDASLNELPSGQAEFWLAVKRSMLSGQFANAMLRKFANHLPDFNGMELGNELLLIMDKRNYALGPHTDSKRKVLSLLFYIPMIEWNTDHGTSLYLPKDREFRCPGGPHHNRDNFDLVTTMKYQPNSLFAFAKSDRSFHGVERVDGTRWLLLFDIFKED